MDLQLPPLRERKEDISILVKRFIANFNLKMNKSVEDIAPDALRMLMNYHWPGNVRELENLIHRSMILCESDCITSDDLPPNLVPDTKSIDSPLFDPSQIPFMKARDGFEHRYLQELLRINSDNVTKSALMAGISRRHLQELIKKYGLRSTEE